jgi:hypothetical protein
MTERNNGRRTSALLNLQFWRKALILALITIIGLPTQPLSRVLAGDEDKPQTKKVVISLSNDLLRHVSSKLRSVIEGWPIQQVEEIIKRAQAQYEQDDACGAAKSLEESLRLVNAVNQQRRHEALEDLYNRLSTLRADMVDSMDERKGCDGSVRVGVEPEVKVGESDNKGLSGAISFGEPRFKSVEADGKLFTQLEIPGAQSVIGEEGMPGVPVFHQLVAVPEGAKAIVRAKARGERSLKLKLYPFQPQPEDRAQSQVSKGEEKVPDDRFKNPPFTINREAYDSNEDFPREVCTITPVGDARGVNLAQISCAAGQYNPATETMTLFDGVDFEIIFEGGNGAFLSSRSLNPFEGPTGNIFAEATINREVVKRYVINERIRFWRLGEEFMILTHPNFRDAADKLAAWKNSKGILTRVFNVNDGAGSGPDTKEAIDALIENEYNRSLIAPSYVLLLGDAEFIPPFYASTSGSATTGTDYPYALLSAPAGDKIPDFAVGRIPVDTLAQADTVVDKIIGYEKTPPFSRSFYRNAAFAAQFQGNGSGQDERTFIEVSELARNQLLAGGYSVERIYTKTGAGTPARYYGGALLPAALGVGSGFAWDGDTTDIVNAFNAGRFLIMHRDHGWEEGWVHPEFTSTNVTNDLSNGSLLPVVFSVNCASGLFDNETAGGDYGTNAASVYFAERLLRKADGGAVGILGDTRNSPSWANTALTRGFFDAVWPNTLPAYGGGGSHRRLGDILNYGKCYLMTQVGTLYINNSTVDSELYLWHVIGDPTLEMWTARPWLFPDIELPIEVNWKWWEWERFKLPIEKAVVTILQESERGPIPIGRGEVKNGEVEIKFVSKPDPTLPVQFSLNAENAVSHTLKLKPGSGVF